eukprot:COSAG01_NODE_38377_length_490_cov_1.191816_1_plen_133_part_01
MRCARCVTLGSVYVGVAGLDSAILRSLGRQQQQPGGQTNGHSKVWLSSTLSSALPSALSLHRRTSSAQLEMPTRTRPSPHIKCHLHKTGHAECGRGRRVERTPPEDAGDALTDTPVAARHLLPRPLQYGCRSP